MKDLKQFQTLALRNDDARKVTGGAKSMRDCSSYAATQCAYMSTTLPGGGGMTQYESCYKYNFANCTAEEAVIAIKGLAGLLK